ncbi:hypothetical protein ANCCAN_01396 [Ancylostoma caninum]|uniref:Uncharacterized protein n=1 Tax=Ancylostoma caninum TaxID=29170 RepID=A0A368H713_ANCCA|nr:hypothetical protein ANCCAN_01396 [Ancylostoma caninum]
MAAFKGSNATALHIFLEQAKAKNFPLHYTTMDCALRGYGAFIVWLHFVMYLIFRHIHREDDDSSPYEDDEKKEYTTTPRIETATPKKMETSMKTAKQKKISSKKSKASGKKEQKKKAKNRSQAEESPGHSYGVDKTQKASSENLGLHVVTPSREYAEEERPELMVRKQDRIETDAIPSAFQKRFLAENDMSSPEKQFSIKDLPLWILLTDRAKDDEAGNEKRLLMAEWLLRRGGMDQVPPLGASNLPRAIPTRDTQAAQMLAAANIPHKGRAPKGEQTDRLTSMEQFLDKLCSAEKGSAEKGSAEKGSAEKGTTEGFSAEVVEKEDETQTVTEKGKKSPLKAPEMAQLQKRSGASDSSEAGELQYFHMFYILISIVFLS